MTDFTRVFARLLDYFSAVGGRRPQTAARPAPTGWKANLVLCVGGGSSEAPDSYLALADNHTPHGKGLRQVVS